MYGGGTFTAQNKILPGAYFNFISAARLTGGGGARGTVAIALPLTWGPDGKVITITNDVLNGDVKALLGYDLDADELQTIREIMRHATTLYLYKLGTGGTKADSTYATAKYAGSRGNAIKIVIAKNVDNATKYDVVTYLGTDVVDTQTVASCAELKANAYVDFKTTATIAETAGEALTGGTQPSITGAAHTEFLAAIESYTFNILASTRTDAESLALYKAFVKRMRDEVGMKCQLVANLAADDYSVINVVQPALIPWVAGAEAGCEIGETLTNAVYDGELTPEIATTQATLESALENGQLIFHAVNGGELRVLDDINSLVTVTANVGAEFKENSTIRLIDGFATEAGEIFTETYMGTPNDDIGRSSFRGQVLLLLDEYVRRGAIEEYDEDDVIVSRGESKYAIVLQFALTTTGTMKKLYGTITIQ